MDLGCPNGRHVNSFALSDMAPRHCSDPSCPSAFESFPDFAEQTHGFAQLYDEVTNNMMGLVTSLPDDKEASWLLYLINAFERQYQAWERRLALRGYLESFRTRSPFQLFRVVGHAYLHIAFDLPRAIAESLSYGPPFGSVKDSDGRPVPKRIRRDRAMALYLQPAGDFLELMDRSARRWDIAGVFLVGGYFPRQLSVMRCLGYWVLALRTTAWMHAEILRTAGAGRPLMEKKLLSAVEEAAKKAEGRFNPLRLMGGLKPPDLPVPAAVPVAAPPEPWAWLPWAPLAVTAAGLVLAVLGFAYLYWWLLRYTDRLGQELHRNIIQALRSEEMESPSQPQ